VVHRMLAEILVELEARRIGKGCLLQEVLPDKMVALEGVVQRNRVD